MNNKEEIFKGGRSAESVVRIGNTVHRTKGTNYKFIHALLQHLEAHNFAFAPHFLGIDKQGREKLSFIEGIVPRGETLSDEQLIGAIKILRKLHDINSMSSLRKNQETICHNDFAPWNIIFNKGIPVGIIDFDDAAPGFRIEDVAYFIWTFLDLGIAKTSDTNQINRVIKLCKAYQLEDSVNLTAAIFQQQDRILKFRNNIIINEVDEEKKVFSQEAVIRIQTSMEWLFNNRQTLEDRLKSEC